MNSNPVISLLGVSSAIPPFSALKVTATGLDVAGPGDRVVGFSLPNDLNRNQLTVQVHASYIEAVLGNNTAVVMGDYLEQAANGQYVKHVSGVIVGVAWVSAATAAGDRFEAFIFRDGDSPAAQAPHVALSSTNGTAGAAGTLAALAAETEHVGDDVRAIYAALVAAGLMAPA